MSYIDDFTFAVSLPVKQRLIDFANHAGAMFMEMDAIRIVRGRCDDVPVSNRMIFRGNRPVIELNG